MSDADPSLVDTGSDDVLQPTASQAVALTVLGPCAVGWILQLFLGGMATALGGSLLLSKIAKVGTFSRPLLIGAILFNLGAVIVNSVETFEYLVSQDRSSTKLDAYTLADTLPPLFEGLAAACCQVFMALRCVKIAGGTKTWSGKILAGLLASGIATSLAGAAWLTAANVAYRAGTATTETLLAPTELWMWAAVATDLLLTGVLSYSLKKMRRGFNKATDQFVSGLIKIAFGSCAVPLLFTTFTAISYAATYNTDTMWNMFNASACAVPSLYLISFCYCLRQTYTQHRKLDGSTYKSAQDDRRSGFFISSDDRRHASQQPQFKLAVPKTAKSEGIYARRTFSPRIAFELSPSIVSASSNDANYAPALQSGSLVGVVPINSPYIQVVLPRGSDDAVQSDDKLPSKPTSLSSPQLSPPNDPEAIDPTVTMMVAIPPGSSSPRHTDDTPALYKEMSI